MIEAAFGLLGIQVPERKKHLVFDLFFASKKYVQIP
ncbi:MAG TPA: hypothetical protein DEB18_01895 [Leeuwenhoekiella sp.]|nr:hypothetical protein [Leeuwenhoekiella sp.]